MGEDFSLALSFKRAWLSCRDATPFILLTPSSWISGLSNEVYDFSVVHVVLDIRAIKVLILIFFVIYLVNRAFFRSFNFDACYLQSHFCYRKIIYLIVKPSFSTFWRSNDMGRGSSIKAPTPILMNSYEFHSNWPGCFVVKATQYVFKPPKSWILGLSNEVYNFSVAQVL